MRDATITRRQGIAGQFSVTAVVRDLEEGPADTLTFVGSVYGGPVVMDANGMQVFVHDPGRFGVFGEDWVRRFLDA